jgi:hypothetical protein
MPIAAATSMAISRSMVVVRLRRWHVVAIVVAIAPVAPAVSWKHGNRK